MLLALMIAASPVVDSAEVSSKSDVLLLHSYHPEFPWTDGVTEGLREALGDHIDPEGLRLEYMDARRHMDDPKFSQLTLSYLHQKYADEHLGLVVLSDEPAFEFWLDHGNQIAPSVPVVFGGVNVPDPASLEKHPEFTGVIEGMEIEKNLGLIADLQPQPGRLIVLGDETKLGQKMVQRVKANLAEYEKLAGDRRIEIWDRFDRFDTLYRQASALQPNDAILVLAVHRDGQDNYWSYSKNLEDLTLHSQAPVYSMWGIALGHGIVGGYVNNPFNHGQELGALGVKLLQGTPVSDVPVIGKTSYAPTFDKKALDRYGINRSHLPQGSTFFGEQDTRTFAQRQPLWLGLTLLAGLFALFRARTLIDSNKQQERRVSKLNQENKRLSKDTELYKNLAMTDELTGIPNRRAGSLHLDGLCEFAKRDQSEGDTPPSLAIAIMDIDRFKAVNDTFGHDVGDEVLLQAAKTLRAQLRPHDSLCRWGGEEFLVVLREMEFEELTDILNRIRKALQNAQIGRKHGVKHLTASFGAAMVDTDYDWRASLELADKELYRAKELGRNRVCLATKSEVLPQKAPSKAATVVHTAQQPA